MAVCHQVESILQPAQDGAAAECFRLILSGSGSSINSLLSQMKQPLLLLWGVRCSSRFRRPLLAHVLLHCTKLAHQTHETYVIAVDQFCPYTYVSCHCGSMLQDRDPWIGPGSADRVMQLYPSATRIRLDAGAPTEPNICCQYPLSISVQLTI